MIIVNRNSVGFVAALLATEIDRVRSETVVFLDPDIEVEEQIRDLLSFQLKPVQTMYTSVSPVWLIDVATGELNWARSPKLRSEWRLITTRKLPQQAEDIFSIIIRGEDILGVLHEWYLRECKPSHVINKWVAAVREQPTLMDIMLSERDTLPLLYEVRAVPPERYTFSISIEADGIPGAVEYISSEAGKYYHVPECTSVKRIRTQITYKTINEAQGAGKAACKICIAI